MALAEAPSKNKDNRERVLHEPRPFLWTRKQYHEMEPLNLFLARRVELIEGQIIEAGSVTAPHIVGVGLSDRAARQIFSDGYFVSIRNPVVLDEYSEPEPDLAIFKGNLRDLTNIPADPVLVIEVADVTLDYDRTTKARIYARAGVADYWVLNVKGEALEVFRNPANGKYDPKVIYKRGQSIAPLASPQSLILVDDLLP